MSEEELIRQLRDPTQRARAFTRLVEAYQQRVYWLIRKMVIRHDDADDLTQEVFVKVWQHLDSFRGESKLFTWLYRIATNECLGFLRKKKRRAWLSFEDVAATMGEALTAQTSLDADDVELKLQRALLRLPDKQRLVFQLRYFEEMKYQDMSEVLGTSVGALKASYHQAAKKVEASLQQEANI